MDVLCFDIGSGGITAACFNEGLETTAIEEIPWQIQRDAAGSATLLAEDITTVVEQLAPRVTRGRPLAALAAGGFMHSHLVLSSCCAPLTPVFTWMDTTGASGIERIRNIIGDRFHRETGCRYHPMFPVFKLAATPAGRGNRVGSPKSLLVQELTGVFVEDFGMASASGMLDLHANAWHPSILNALELDIADLPVLGNPDDVAGKVTAAASERFGIPRGTAVVLGSGDGFLANIGSGCTTPERIAVTLGTSGVARQMRAEAVVEEDAGTFCYRASTGSFLLGCASSNGGNVLDWAHRLFGPMAEPGGDIPLFLPWVHGERSFEWNSGLAASFHGVNAAHDASAFSRAAAEGVLFNLAQYVERLRSLTASGASVTVLSGNGFLDPQLPATLSALIGGEVLLPAQSGQASLRGAAIHAWKAVGHDATPHVDAFLQQAQRIAPAPDTGIRERFARFKSLRIAGC